MCGISGILARDPTHPIPQEWIQGMMTAQAHRGPDDSHYARFPGCVLGFNRLSVLDLSTRGRQPMRVEGASASMVFNGEIYNYLELAEEHRVRGVRFRSRADSEVLLQTVLWKGDDCFDRLNGMFAFAIYDAETEEIFAARDRFGVKPFYYYLNAEFFCFASEIKALLQLPFVPRRPNLQALFGAGFERSNDRTEQTCFEGILQLRPAHRFRMGRRSWSPEIRRYWPLPGDPEPAPPEDRDAEERLCALLRSAVALRLRSDRPVGLLLSGGLDSSSLAATLAELGRSPGGVPGGMPRCFTMALPGESEDESAVAEQTCRLLALPGVRIPADAPDFERLIPAALWHNDEPLPLLNRCVHYAMMERIAREGIIVILNGQGGDETTGGYFDRLVGATVAMALREDGVPGAVREWRGARTLAGFGRGWMLSQFLKTFVAQRWVRTFRAVTAERALRLATRRFLAAGVLRDEAPRLVPADRVNDQLLRWLTRDTVPDLCHYEDRNAAAFGLEERFPFLDVRLVEYLFRLPWKFKTFGGESKAMLRSAMRGRLPAAVVESHRKIGLAVPEDKWVRGPLAGMVRDLAASRSFRERGLWRPGPVRSLIESHIEGKVEAGNLIWRIVGTELWFRMFLDAASGSRTPLPTRDTAVPA